MTTTPNPSPAWEDEAARNLAAIVRDLSCAIDAEPDHGKRHKLKEARELVRDVVWGTDETAPLPPSREAVEAAIRHGEERLRLAAERRERRRPRTVKNVRITI